MLAQNLVSTAPQNKKVVLEEFTRIHCGNCPAGNVIANGILDMHHGNVFLLGLHSGSLAVPNVGEPDFRHPDAEALADQFNLNGTPKALVSRAEYAGNVLLGTAVWPAAADEVLSQSAPVNVGIATDFNAGTRELEVTVELYYTLDAPVATNYLTVVLSESGIIGWQTDYVNGNQPNYQHNHVFRGHITDIWGDEVTDTQMGSLVSRTYTMTVPVDFDINNSHVLAYVGEYQSEIYNAMEVAANGGTTVGVSESEQELLGAAYPVPASSHLWVPILGEVSKGVIQLFDATGKQVQQVSVSQGATLVKLDVGALASGLYNYRFVGENAVSKARSISLVR